jgi:hypothetical protein
MSIGSNPNPRPGKNAHPMNKPRAPRAGRKSIAGGRWRSGPRKVRRTPEERAEWHEVAGEGVWPETEDGEWDYLRPGREAEILFGP